MTIPVWGDRAVQMARGGNTIEGIRKELRVSTIGKCGNMCATSRAQSGVAGEVLSG